MVRGRPQPTPARQRNVPQTIPWKRAWRERERFRAPRVSTVSFSDPPEPSTNRRQRTKRHPNDSLETRMARAGALQGARGIKSILSGPPSPSRAFLPPQDRVQGLARKRPPPGNETTPKRYPGNAYNTSGSAPGRPWYQKCCFRTPLAKTRLHWTVARGSHPNDPRQTTNAPH